MSRLRTLVDAARLPLALYVLFAGVYVAMLGGRVLENSPDDHYVHLANSFLHGRLDQGGNPPGRNDWACFDHELEEACPNGAFLFPPSQWDRYKFYVSFPPFPAVLLVPVVAAMGVDVPDRLVFALLAGLGPTSLFLLLRRLRALGHSRRSVGEDLLLTVSFGFGTVFFFAAEQGTVWFAAHVVSVPLACLFLGASVDARRPGLAGLAIGLLFLTRPTTALFGLFFVHEAFRVHADDARLGWVATLRTLSIRPFLATCARFAVPSAACLALALAMNHARFADPLVFGHEYLQIVWRTRIETWGLFNYHYVAKNLSVLLAGLPWLSRYEPHLLISGHGLAIWVTTPTVLYALYPRERGTIFRPLAACVALVLVADLMYQNSGWLQFGYRFAIDYLPAVFVLLALSGQRFTGFFRLLVLYAIAVNAFGAVTYDRVPRFYHVEPTQNVLFQPD